MKTVTGFFSLSIFLVLMAASCANKDSASEDSGSADPLRKQFIPDAVPLHPKGSKSLQSYALTLPIFEASDHAYRVAWVTSSEPRRESPDKLVLVGQGAQCDVALERVSRLEASEQIVRLVLSSELDPGEDHVYDLVRVEGGWKCIGLKNEHGVWDQMFNQASSCAKGNRAQQEGTGQR